MQKINDFGDVSLTITHDKPKMTISLQKTTLGGKFRMECFWRVRVRRVGGGGVFLNEGSGGFVASAKNTWGVNLVRYRRRVTSCLNSDLSHVLAFSMFVTPV